MIKKVVPYILLYMINPGGLGIMQWKKTLFQSSLITLIAINLMLSGLLISQKWIRIDSDMIAVTSLAKTSKSKRVDYHMEWIDTIHRSESAKSSPTGKDGSWRVEHYREMEYTFDHNGRLISVKPTSKEEYLRYWEQ